MATTTAQHATKTKFAEAAEKLMRRDIGPLYPISSVLKNRKAAEEAFAWLGNERLLIVASTAIATGVAVFGGIAASENSASTFSYNGLGELFFGLICVSGVYIFGCFIAENFEKRRLIKTLLRNWDGDYKLEQ